MTETLSYDPTAPLTASGNLRRRHFISGLIEVITVAAAAVAVAVLGIVIYTVVSRGASALTLDFLIKGSPEGIGPAIVGTALIVAIATAISAPIGVLIALYTTEFGSGRPAAVVRASLDLMNGLPSIIIGLFIFGLLVVGKGQSALAAGVALAIIMLPLVARGSQEILELAPPARKEAAEALGVNRWRIVLGVTLPGAAGGIVTATVLAIARAAGETAPLIFACSVFDSSSFSFNPTQALPNIPVTIFQLSEEANPESFSRAWGAALVLMAFIMLASFVARATLAKMRAGSGG